MHSRRAMQGSHGMHQVLQLSAAAAILSDYAEWPFFITRFSPPSSFIFNSKCMAASLPLPCIHPHSQVHNNDLLAAAAADHATAIYSICTRMCNKMWEKNISIDDTKEAECRRVTAFALS